MYKIPGLSQWHLFQWYYENSWSWVSMCIKMSWLFVIEQDIIMSVCAPNFATCLTHYMKWIAMPDTLCQNCIYCIYHIVHPKRSHQTNNFTDFFLSIWMYRFGWMVITLFSTSTYENEPDNILFLSTLWIHINRKSSLLFNWGFPKFM